MRVWCHTATLQHIITDCRKQDKQEVTEDAQTESEKHITQSHMPKTVKEVMCHMNKYAWNNVETEKKGLELGEQQWDETQQQIARALQARWTGAVNKGLNNTKGLGKSYSQQEKETNNRQTQTIC
jgi:hypothetical protein